uniref:hypothetical protein n=1 Tax=Clostridium sp. NkU-1 TaxID=1095009 RepID=UPI000A95528E
MEMLVCIKQVPDDSVEISLDPAAKEPALEGITPVVNAFDTYALEMAARLKETLGGEITVVSIGNEGVKKFSEKLSRRGRRRCISGKA